MREWRRLLMSAIELIEDLSSHFGFLFVGVYMGMRFAAAAPLPEEFALLLQNIGMGLLFFGWFVRFVRALLRDS